MGDEFGSFDDNGNNNNNNNRGEQKVFENNTNNANDGNDGNDDWGDAAWGATEPTFSTNNATTASSQNVSNDNGFGGDDDWGSAAIDTGNSDGFGNNSGFDEWGDNSISAAGGGALHDARKKMHCYGARGVHAW